MGAAEEAEAIRSHAGAALRPEVRSLELTGPDRVRFLNGMVTNEVSRLAEGAGTLAIKTSNRGRIEGVLRVRARGESLLLDLLEAVSENVRTTLDEFIIMDDCAIRDVSGGREVVTILGPGAAEALQRAGHPVPQDLRPHAFAAMTQAGLTAIRDVTLGVSGFELHTPAGTGAALLAKLVEAGAREVSAAGFDLVRVESGVPIDGRDLDGDTIPMEARLERAISTTKGCYIGQEVIARAITQGQVNHLLIGAAIEGDGAPAEGTPLDLDGKPVGELTSVVHSAAAGGIIALGFVHRKVEAPGTVLSARSSGGRTWRATVRALPFVDPIRSARP